MSQSLRTGLTSGDSGIYFHEIDVLATFVRTSFRGGYIIPKGQFTVFTDLKIENELARFGA